MFDDSVARLISHEIDHLNGTLYTERMASNTAPIPVSQYAQGGRAWEYQG